MSKALCTAADPVRVLLPKYECSRVSGLCAAIGYSQLGIFRERQAWPAETPSQETRSDSLQIQHDFLATLIARPYDSPPRYLASP